VSEGVAELEKVAVMRSSTVEISTRDGVADAYLTRPDEGERHPGVLLVMDA
jgi:carboxymethylenebutenolidase